MKLRQRETLREREREREREKRESRVGFNKLQVEFGVNLKVCHSP